MNTEKIMEDIQSVQDNIREIKSTWGNTIMTLDNIKSGLKADVQKKADEAYKRGYNDAKQNAGEDYQRGYCEGYKKCLSENDFDQPCVSCEDYQRGLDDAMSAFKKLYSCGWERDWKAMGFEFDDGEWSTSFEYIIGHYTAAEIVEKVKAYEKSTKHFGVGDFVSHNNKPEITVLVTYVRRDTFNGIAVADVEGHCHIGEAYSYCASENWHKVNMQLVKGEDNA